MTIKTKLGAEIPPGSEIQFQNKLSEVPTIYTDAIAGAALTVHVTKIYLGEQQPADGVMNGRIVASLAIPNDQLQNFIGVLQSIVEQLPKLANPKAE